MKTKMRMWVARMARGRRGVAVIYLVAILLAVSFVPTGADHHSFVGSRGILHAAAGNISNEPDSYSFGNVSEGMVKATGLDAFTVTNVGNASVDISISGTNMTSGWLGEYAYRKAITVDSSSDGDLTNYAVRLMILKDEVTKTLHTTEHSATATAPSYAVAAASFAAADCGGLTRANGNLKIDLKASASLAAAGQTEITSGGTADVEEWHKQFVDVTSSYVTYTIPLSNWGFSGIQMDTTAINYIRWYARAVSGAVTIYWRNAYIVFDEGGNTVNLDGHCQDDFDDIRFTSADGTTELDYWVEEYDSGEMAVVWVEIPLIDSSEGAELFLYYDDSAVSSSGSAGEDTFAFFDDFPGGALNTTKWTSVIQDGGATVGVGSGVCIVEAEDIGVARILRTRDEDAIHSRFKFTECSATDRNRFNFGGTSDCGIFDSGSYLKVFYGGGLQSGVYDQYVAEGWYYRGVSNYISVDSCEWNLFKYYDTDSDGDVYHYDADYDPDPLSSSHWYKAGDTPTSGEGKITIDWTFELEYVADIPMVSDIAAAATTGHVWVLSDTATPGSDVFGLAAGLSGGSYDIVVKQTPTYNVLKAGLAASQTQDWGLQILAPSTISDYSAAMTGTVTLTAVES